jgi:hypothetical protein
MDFAEFADAVDGDGIFWGFRAVRLYVLRCSARLPVRRGLRRSGRSRSRRIRRWGWALGKLRVDRAR